MARLLLERATGLETLEQEHGVISLAISFPLAKRRFSNHKYKDPFEVVQLLIDLGAKVDTVDSSGITPLYHACAAGYPRTVQVLIDASADYTTTHDLIKSNVDAPPHATWWMNLL